MELSLEQAKSCIAGSNIFIFCGKINENSCFVFHVINLETHECFTVNFDRNNCPAGSEGHVLASFLQKKKNNFERWKETTIYIYRLHYPLSVKYLMLCLKKNGHFTFNSIVPFWVFPFFCQKKKNNNEFRG